MKNVLFGLAFAAVFAVRAQDSYLYWLMDSEPSVTYDSIQISAIGDGTQWKATPLDLAIEGSDGYLTFGKSVTKDEAAALASAGYGFYVNLGMYATEGYTYYFELVADKVVVAHSGEGLTWDDASKMLAQGAMAGGGTANGTWKSSESGGIIDGPTPVPEPTSGLMLLLGVAALALRRRRA